MTKPPGYSEAESAPGDTAPPDGVTPVAAVSGAPGATIQQLLREFAAGLRRAGVRVAGVLEVPLPTPPNVKRRLALTEIGGTSQYPISQNLGEGSKACNLDVSGLTEACGAVETALGAEVDLLIISKFGKLEAAGQGLRDAFLLAISEGVPVLTAVNPALLPEWTAFVGNLGTCLPANAEAIESWWQGAPRRH